MILKFINNKRMLWTALRSVKHAAMLDRPVRTYTFSKNPFFRGAVIRNASQHDRSSYVGEFQDKLRFQALIENKTSLREALPFLARVEFDSNIEALRRIQQPFEHYVRKIMEANPDASPDQLIQLMNALTKIQAKSNLKSAELSALIMRFFNKAWRKEQSQYTTFMLVSILGRSNAAVGRQYFNKYVDINLLKCIPKEDLVFAITLMSRIELWPAALFEYCLSALYPVLNELKPEHLTRLTEGLAKANRFVNRDFLNKLVESIMMHRQSFEEGSLALQVFDAMSAIEKNQKNPGQYLFELDDLYEMVAKHVLKNGVKYLKINKKMILCSALRRAGYFSQELIDQLLASYFDKHIQRNNAGGDRVEVLYLVELIHLQAYFNCDVGRSPAKEFFAQSFKQLDGAEVVAVGNCTKLLWALSVLFPPEVVANYAARYMGKLLGSPDKSEGQLRNLHYFELYFRRSAPSVSRMIAEAKLPGK